VAKFVEHADPTGVITAGTIALPLESQEFVSSGKRDGISYLHRHDQPEIRYGKDRDGHLHEVLLDGQKVPVRRLEEVLDADSGRPVPTERSGVALTCGEDAVLRHILRSRLHSTLPVVVTHEDGRIRGLIDDPELINGILEKRGHIP
jgi:glycine betaine/proline transport system ATP-binding protein